MWIIDCIQTIKADRKTLIPLIRGFFIFPGKKLLLYGKVTILNKKNVAIGVGCALNHGVLLQGRTKVVLGDYINISQVVMILDGGLLESDIFNKVKRKRHCAKPVIIHDHVWIGAGAIILPGVTIGEQSIVAAGSVVTRDIPPRWMVAGVPARLIRPIQAKE
ncbi:MAG: hypothetical protein A2173_01015 [Planctomycetes bacterium RBG_13_44_8b]|nr:MAG: hypothetical protein A2173_01015 [Planctomycetes bacterium RBG_13_44_8b]